MPGSSPEDVARGTTPHNSSGPSRVPSGTCSTYAGGDSITQSTTSGTVFFLNTNFLQIQYDLETNWITTDFQKPENQDAKVAHIMWYGSHGVMNRRKQGILFSIDTTIAA